jgi:phosphatidylserine decarboxylase
MAILHTPIPDTDEVCTGVSSPEYYIERWAWLVESSPTGNKLTEDNAEFRTWFKRFLDLHGTYLSSPTSLDAYDCDSNQSPMQFWRNFHGSADHRYNYDWYVEPEGGFQTYGEFFLRILKAGERPLSANQDNGAECDEGVDECDTTIVAPCDGGVFCIETGSQSHQDQSYVKNYVLPGKSGDDFNVVQAIPGYGTKFVGKLIMYAIIIINIRSHHHACYCSQTSDSCRRSTVVVYPADSNRRPNP